MKRKSITQGAWSHRKMIMVRFACTKKIKGIEMDCLTDFILSKRLEIGSMPNKEFVSGF